jgi:hypothetical protein
MKKDILWKFFYDNKVAYVKEDNPSLNILILNAPCNGFGDLIFAYKLSTYLKNSYNCSVIIATTLEDGLLKLGVDKKDVVGFTSKSKNLQCRRFSRLKLNKEIPKSDLIFVAPVQVDYTPELNDVKKIIPYATKFNTFFFSEYNDTLNKNFDFNTGIGGKRDGIFIEPIKDPKGVALAPENLFKDVLKNPYVVIYVAESIPRVNSCITSFLEMVCKKCIKKGIKNIDVVIPPWFTEVPKIMKDRLDKYDEKIFITFRNNILPVSNEKMLSLIKYSMKDILLTGDQSLSDALGCCPEKNIFYQIAPWKKNLGNNLSKILKNRHFKSVKTSCGGIRAIRYNSHHNVLTEKWNFMHTGKEKLDAVILSGIYLQKNLP